MRMVLNWKICQICKIYKREWFSFTIWKVCQIDENDSHLQSLANQLVANDYSFENDYHLHDFPVVPNFPRKYPAQKKRAYSPLNFL